jgi:hypothetical protein
MIPSRAVYVPRYVPAVTGTSAVPMVRISLPCEPWLRAAPVAAPVAPAKPKRVKTGLRRAGRTCAVDGCETVLNPYTKGEVCKACRRRWAA